MAMDYLFRDPDDVLVDMELVVYYERGNNQAWLRPDLQVVFGVAVPQGNRSAYKVWEEGKGPDFVLEDPSRTHDLSPATERRILHYLHPDARADADQAPRSLAKWSIYRATAYALD